MSGASIESDVPPAVQIDHVMVVGGTGAQWAAMTDDTWRELAGQWAAAARRLLGAKWVTLLPYGSSGGNEAHRAPRVVMVGDVTVIIDPEGDGRHRFARAAATIEGHDDVDENRLRSALLAPAESDPDLIIVLGACDRIPPSLTWELAYAELVFTERDWLQFAPDDLAVAVAEYQRRERRFGAVAE